MSAFRVFVASALALLLELDLIRYLGTEIPAVGFFKNLVLIGAFLGLGIGLRIRWRLDAALAAVVALIALPLLLVRAAAALGVAGVPFVGSSDDAVLLWHEPRAVTLVLLGASFAVGAAPLVAAGAVLGRYLEEHGRPLGGYGWNLAGSLCGILLFTALSALSLSPRGWFSSTLAIALGLVVAEARRLSRRALVLTAIGAAVVAAALATTRTRDVFWTPYYKVTLAPMGYASGQLTGWGLEVNGTWFQRSFDMRLIDRPEEATENAHDAQSLRYVAPFEVAQPRRVLVLGGGLGNDAASALAHGASEVYVVDIDPDILRLSDRFHPNRPYRDPRVRLIVDDARHFLETDRGRYDLILFGVLEARSLFSQFANLRLDNYVYTLEALEAARDRLTDRGVLWLNMWVPKAWVFTKFARLTTEVFGGATAVLHGRGSAHYSFVVCPICSREAVARAVAPLPMVEPATPPEDDGAAVTVPTDDWPYVFFRARGVPLADLALLALLVGLSVLGLRAASPDLFRVDWTFFLLGAGFLLLETNAVVRMALLAGTTWFVNAAVFCGVLLFGLAANAIVARRRPARIGALFAALAAALLVLYGFPFASLLALPHPWGAVSGAALLTLPVLFSSLVFSTLFATVASPSRALGSNLFGAVLGGFAEYGSMLTGNRAIVLIALAIYAGAYLARRLGPEARAAGAHAAP